MGERAEGKDGQEGRQGGPDTTAAREEGVENEIKGYRTCGDGNIKYVGEGSDPSLLTTDGRDYT